MVDEVKKEKKLRVLGERRNSMILFDTRATQFAAAVVCILAMVTSQELVRPVSAVQPEGRMGRVEEQKDEYVPGEVLVLLSADADRNGIVSAAENLSGVEAAVGGQIKRRIALSRGKEVLRVKLPTGKSVEQAIAENWKARDRRILVVEPNYRVRIARTPNDPYFPSLWGMHNTGQTGGTNDADIDAPEAWDITTGAPDGSSVIVGVIDTGIDYLHPDLVDNMWVNTGEIPGNGIDDDGNGYEDDVYGYDFYQDDGDPSDAAGHGTHCAGTIAGVGDNGLGVAGVNWQCKLMALRFLNAEGSGNTAVAIEAVNYGVANGVKILSNSWGGGGYSESMEAAIINARDHGVLFVAAAGNWSLNNDAVPHYPSSYEVSNVISVAATDHRDSLAGFSNYGAESVDVGAPGVGILSCFPKYRTVFVEDFQGAVNRPGFEGTQMMPDGPVNRWGTVISPMPYDQNNIAVRSDWEHSWPYLSGSYGSIVTPSIDTRGMRGLTLEFDYRYEIGRGDELTVYVWDGTAWQEVFSRHSTCCYKEGYLWTRIDIPESYRNSGMKVKFSWVTDDVDNEYFGAEIDNIHIKCIDDYVDNYAWSGGTSMATPHVAGVAALIMANAPVPAATPMSLEELKSRILWTGDVVPALDGRTVSGRRLNAYNALAASLGVTVVSPNGGESWELPSSRDIKWCLISSSPVVDIYLLKGGDIYTQLAEDVPNEGKFTWEIPESLPSDTDYRILITDGTYSDVSDGDFELLCTLMEMPIYPVPYDGASDVAVDTKLKWHFAGTEPVTITFDEVPKGTVVNGMVVEDVTFGFSSLDASVTDEGPGDTLYIKMPNIEGDAEGILTLDFAMPVFGVSYGFALSAIGSQADASTMVLIDRSLRPIGTFSADAIDMGFGYIEGINSGTSTTPIAHAIITFSNPDPYMKRFAVDNLTYSSIVGTLPEAASMEEREVANEADDGEHQDANVTNGNLKPWLQSDLAQPEYLLRGVHPGVESTVKESAASESMSANIGEMSVGGPDCGNYIFIDSNEPNGPSFDWIEIAAEPPPVPKPWSGETELAGPEYIKTADGNNLHLGDDDYNYPIVLPFQFSFYGTDYNHVGVGSNGTIYFEDHYLGLYNCCIPCNPDYYVQRFIAVYWDDLHPNPNGDDNVYVAVVGDAPNRIFVVQWENVRHFGSQDRVTCQAQLFEGSNDILLLYADPSLEAGFSATVGIQKDRKCGLNYICNQVELHPGLAVLFRYQPPCPATWDVYLGTDPNALELIESDMTTTICDPTPEPGETLKRGVRYYWQVVMKNCCSVVDGNDWTFTTENTPPVADAGDEQIVECACNTEQGTRVALDGSRSSDADETPLTYTWTGPFRESPAQGAAPTVTLDSGCPGGYVMTLVVNDGIEDSEPNDVVITVVDTTPPEFEFSVTPTFLWPPSHEMVLITPSWAVSDECDATPQVSLVSVVMNESDGTIGDGHTTDDIQIGDDGSIYVRSERSGTNSGRIYTIIYQAVDDSENATVRSATVSIPHDFKILARIAQRWLWEGPTGSIPVDFNGDGIVNLMDFAIFAKNWIK